VHRLVSFANTDDGDGNDDGAPKYALEPQCNIPSLEGVLVTCLHWDNDEEYLWVGTADGRVKAYALSGDDDQNDYEPSLSLRLAKEWKIKDAAVVLSIAVEAEIGVAVVATSGGTVELLQCTEEDFDEPNSAGDVMALLFPPFDSGRKSSIAFCRSVAVVKLGNDSSDDSNRHVIVMGANDGSLFLQPLHLDEDTEMVHAKTPFGTADNLATLQPSHQGPVMCLASPCPGLWVSGAQDGRVRVWRIEQQKSNNNTDEQYAESECLYEFGGYKVWVGSLWTDGTRLVSDGADNTVIMHDFSSSSSADSPTTSAPDEEEENL